MEKGKKTALLVAGSMIALGTVAYLMLPKEGKTSIRNMVDNLSSDKKCSNPMCQCQK